LLRIREPRTYVELEDENVIDSTIIPSCEIDKERESEEDWEIASSEELQ